MTAADAGTGRERILQQAFLLFLARGYDATATADIVRAAGMSKGAVYHHFAGKEALFQAVVDRYLVDVVRPSAEHDAEELGFGATVHAAADALLTACTQVASLGVGIPAYFRFQLDAVDRCGARVRQVASLRLEQLTQAAQRDLDRSALATKLDAEALARQALATIEGTALLAAVEDPASLERSLRDAVAALLAAHAGNA